MPTWRERYAETGPWYDLLAEDEHGDLWVPSRFIKDWWDRRYQWWNPWHWPARVRTGRRGMVMIETVPEQ